MRLFFALVLVSDKKSVCLLDHRHDANCDSFDGLVEDELWLDAVDFLKENNAHR